MCASIWKGIVSPAACAAASPSATCEPISINCESASGPRSIKDFTFDVFHHQEIDPIGFFNRINRNDIGMIQSGSRPRFLKQPPFRFLVLRNSGRQKLYGHLAPSLASSAR